MQAYAETASKAVAEAENALRNVVDHKEPGYGEFEPLLEKLRKHSQDQIFLTFPSAVAKLVEDRLWENHLKVNKKFQKHLKQFREGNGKKKHVERRKAEKHYLSFIKASMHFYRGYIQRLASRFGNIREVYAIANKLHLDMLSVDTPVVVSTEHQNAVLGSCHSALMRLGDLSRYRETELETKNRNWGPAKGHYQLALSVKPESGAAYNQLAVMALADDDHLRAVYYLHRAATTSKPFPVARDNIKLEFEKLLKLEPEEKSAIADTSKQTLEVLENRFLAFHANCHSRPSDFVTYSVKATQILQLVTVSFGEIKDRSLDKLLQKLCLVSIAAEHLAWRGVYNAMQELAKQDEPKTEKERKLDDKRKVEHERNCQSVYLLQRFNILTFTTLLKTTARELADGDNGSEGVHDPNAAIVPLPVRRLLPHLRQYSSWLLSNIHSLLSPRHTSTMKYLEQFWKSYANVANLLLAKFSIADIEDINYLLEEDEDTLSFAPFSTNVILWRYSLENGARKPPLIEQTQNNSTNAEMLARIRRFVFDAATITNQKVIAALQRVDDYFVDVFQDKLKIDWAPISLLNGEFVFEETKAVPVVVAKPSTPTQPFRSRAHAHASSMNGISPVPSPKPNKKPDNESRGNRQADLHIHKDERNQDLPPVAMENMVANLVNFESVDSDPQPTKQSLQAPSVNLNSSSLSTGSTDGTQNPMSIMDFVRGMQQRSTQAQSQPDIMDFVRGMQQRSDGSVSAPPPNLVSHNVRSNNPSLPGIWSTAFTPRPGEAPGSSPRPDSSSGLSPSRRILSSGFISSETTEQERDRQSRMSPFQAPAMSSWPEPQRSPGFPSQQLWQSGPGSPWQSPSSRKAAPQQRPLPQAALFGAIGEPRKHGSRSPPGRQPS